MARLNARLVETAKAGKYGDSSTKGLQLAVSPTGEEMGLSLRVTGQAAQGFRNEKHKAQWRTTLTVYAEPLRRKTVGQIETDGVMALLKPIWLEKPETASHLRGRIEKVLNAAKAIGYRTGENHGARCGHLENLLLIIKQSKLSRGIMRRCPMPMSLPSSPNSAKSDATAALALNSPS
jgi:hypothetical protein